MSDAEAVLPVPPSVEVTLPVVLFCAPAAMPVTLTENVHVPLAAIDADPRLTEPDPAVAVTAAPPPQPVNALSPLGVEIISPAGKVSLKPTPVSEVVAFGFVAVNVRVVKPFSGMLAAPNAFTSVGGLTIVTF